MSSLYILISTLIRCISDTYHINNRVCKYFFPFCRLSGPFRLQYFLNLHVTPMCSRIWEQTAEAPGCSKCSSHPASVVLPAAALASPESLKQRGNLGGHLALLNQIPRFNQLFQGFMLTVTSGQHHVCLCRSCLLHHACNPHPILLAHSHLLDWPQVSLSWNLPHPSLHTQAGLQGMPLLWFLAQPPVFLILDPQWEGQHCWQSLLSACWVEWPRWMSARWDSEVCMARAQVWEIRTSGGSGSNSSSPWCDELWPQAAWGYWFLLSSLWRRRLWLTRCVCSKLEEESEFWRRSRGLPW